MEWVCVYEYVDDKLSKKTYYSIDGELEDYDFYEYDAKGNLQKISENYYYRTKDGNLNEKMYAYQTFEYNDENQLIEMWRHDKTYDRKQHERYEYLSDGTVMTISYREDGMIGYYEINEYDSEGNLIKLSHYYEGDVLGYTYEYRPDGTQKKALFYENGALHHMSVFNEHGIVEMTYAY